MASRRDDSIRAACLASWVRTRGSERTAGCTLNVNAAAMAGLLLVSTGYDAAAALVVVRDTMAACGVESYWGNVEDYLQRIIDEEASATRAAG